MAEYTAQIDQQITQLLQTRQMVSPSMIAGLSEADAQAFLQHYAQIHPDLARFDGGTLMAAPPTATPTEPAPEGVYAEQGADVQPPPPVPGLGDTAAVGEPSLPPGAEGTYATPPGQTYVPQSEIPIDAMPEFQQREPVPKWPWILPIIFGWVGGLIAWIVVRDRDSDTARNMLILGVAISAISLCLSVAVGSCAGGFSSATVTDTAWPATQRTTFYYFGSPN